MPAASFLAFLWVTMAPRYSAYSNVEQELDCAGLHTPPLCCCSSVAPRHSHTYTCTKHALQKNISGHPARLLKTTHDKNAQLSRFLLTSTSFFGPLDLFGFNCLWYNKSSAPSSYLNGPITVLGENPTYLNVSASIYYKTADNCLVRCRNTGTLGKAG